MVSINDIFNRPPTISEDTLQYLLYLPQEQSDRVSATTLATLMLEYTQSLLPDHLWHRDSFELKVAPDPEGNKDAWVLEGRMRVGDCIDDEWCAVWLLREISKKWDVVISVWDSDGEFLLIEAADELPSWVTPSNAENRVWIHNSRLHLIPLSHVSPPSSKTRRRKYLPHQSAGDEEELNENEDEQDFITATDAVKLVRDPLVETTAPEKVEQVVWRRISGYPAASHQHMHVTKAYLPVDVAKALAVNPPLVQKAVEAFYTRDALQLRAAQKMARFPPEPSVLVSVRMTRTAYAQLVGQRFHPPKVFGRWPEKEGTREWRWRDVGMKIAYGFEMLYQESKNRKDTLTANFDGSPASLDALKDNLRRNPEYSQYIQRLVSAGYFRGELEGSQKWSTLENHAAAAFVAARKEDDASRPSFASAVQASISQYTDDRALPSEDEDLDDWLNVDAADFDAMLEKTVGLGKGKGKAGDAMDVDASEDEDERIAKAQAARLKDLAKQVEDFVEGEGDVEGARFADEAFSDEGDSDDTDGREHEENEVEAMDEDEPAPTSTGPQLTEEERKARQEAMDKLVPALDPSDYGKMPPSFHSNSQRTAPVTLETEVREERPAGSGSGSSEGVRARPIRPPILPRDKFDGVDSDDETDEEEHGDEEDDDEHPQVVGEVEIDMAEEEDEFIEFARQALGVSDEQWKDILKERGERGVYVPSHVVNESKHMPEPQRPSEVPSQTPRAPSSRSQPNTSLDSFEAVMRAMDAELARARGERTAPESADAASSSKGKGKMAAGDQADMDIEAAMEAELRESLEKGEEEEEDKGGEVDYQLIKNFLESFKSQAGMAGPVSNLVGRLQQGWTLPRDEL
ncbi:SGT1-domain-containing protein [Pilatotrama ljubarskyi]|nr:SGT1-domain-containing protein [Pilatotrama ljubarskyi]